MSESNQGISRHFSREGKIVAAFFLGILLLGLLVAVLVPILMPHSGEAACINSGGNYNGQSRVCEHSPK